ncbi:phosphodiesterase [Phreatobacter cathodiphilus]|nr:phosphodiesterase [Phreatobacter cathodiphilus]
MLIAHLTDTHIVRPGTLFAGRFDTLAALDRAVPRLAALRPRPDLLVVSGDLAEEGTPEVYAILAERLARIGLPMLAVPGNHDVREAMAAALPEATGTIAGGFLCSMRAFGAGVVIGLDTLAPDGASHGELCERRLAWLEERLRETQGRERLIVMHHPPFTTGLAAMDAIGLRRGTAELAALLAAHPGTQAILCGHVHRAIQASIAGVPIRLAPSASHAMDFDLDPAAPYRFKREPAQFMLHLWDQGEGVVSHTLFVEEHPDL